MNIYICKFCKKDFQNRKPNKVYCSQKCYFANIAEVWRCEKECAICKKCYIPTHKKQTYCGHKCHGKILRELKKTSVIVSCIKCCKQFERRISAISKNGKIYCSRECTKSPTTKICEKCKKEYRISSSKWKNSRFCTKSCAKSGENHHFFGKTGPTKGIKPWIAGLTKETDQRVATMADKVSKKHKEQFASGARSNKGENNPNYGITSNMRTPEQLDRYSKASTERILNSKSTKHKRYIKGWHNSIKTIKPMLFRSSLEKRMMVCLDKDTTVASYQYESFFINYSENKRYIPDFLVTYNDGKKCLIETKGGQFLADDSTHKKTQAALFYCHEKGYEYKIYSTKEIKNYENLLKIFFSLHDLKKELQEYKNES